MVFLGMAGIQWFVPLQMIQGNRSTLITGSEYKFKIAPIDPEDPFRGKYLRLRFQEDHLAVPPGIKWEAEDIVYAVIEEDPSGYALIAGLSRDEPALNDTDYIKSSVRAVHGKDSLMVYIHYPFDRYYINERMAGPLEEILTENRIDTSKTNYAVVRIKSGEALLEEVFVDGLSIPEWYEKWK